MVTKVVSIAAGVALMLAIAVTPALAHHSFAAEFDDLGDHRFISCTSVKHED